MPVRTHVPLKSDHRIKHTSSLIIEDLLFTKQASRSFSTHEAEVAIKESPGPLHNRRLLGATQVVASAIGYGMIGIFGKWAYASRMRPGELLSLRFLVASVVLWTYAVAARRSPLKMSFQQMTACAALGVLGYAVFTTLYFHALEGLSASLTILLLYTYPVMVTLGAHWLFKERVTWKQGSALPLVCAGLLMLSYGSGDISVVKGYAIWLALLAAVFYAAYILASRQLLRSVNALAAGLYIMTAATVTFILLSPPGMSRIAELNVAAWGSVIGLALVSTVGPMTLFLSGLKKLTSTETSLLSIVEPITATTAAALMLHESLSRLQIAGGVLIIGALIFLSFGRRGSIELPNIT